MIRLWRDWTMMNRLHCTWTELRAEPYEEIQIFDAFARGEAAANEAKKDALDAR